MAQRDLDWTSVIVAGLGMKKDHGLAAMLRAIAKLTGAFGCAIWELVQGEDEAIQKGPSGHIFVLADWFPGSRRYARHDLPVDQSTTAQTILSGQPQIINDIDSGNGARRAHEFIRRHNLNRKMSAPIQFTDGKRGSINVYRKSTAAPFTPAELDVLVSVIRPLPSLYRAARDQISLNLIGEIDSLLHRADSAEPRSPRSKAQMKRVFRAIAEAVQRQFNCLEVSIFLQDRANRANTCELMSSTWPDKFKRTEIEKTEQEGLTGYVLAKGRSVRIFDLATYDADEDRIRRRYPGLRWKDSLNIRTSARRILKIRPPAELPPLSLMASPILLGHDTFGVIRCCTSTKGPYYFTDRELELLELVAAQISRFWSIWLNRIEMQAENRFWRDLVHSVAELNRTAQAEFVKPNPETTGLYEAAQSSILTALGDPVTVKVHGTVAPVSSARLTRRKNDSLTLSQYLELAHEQTAHLLISPARGRSLGPVGSTAGALFATQLLLYNDLFMTVRELYATKERLDDQVRELSEFQKRQTQTFQDLSHQLKNPLISAENRTSGMLKSGIQDFSSLTAVHCLCRRAHRVAKSLKLLSDLAAGNKPKLTKVDLDADRVRGMLIEFARDVEYICDPGKGIRCTVIRTGLDFGKRSNIQIDYDLLQQAIDSLIDNAVKYCFENTVVRVSGGLNSKGKFRISVENRGIRFRPGETQLARGHGWRGEEAKWVTGEGSGIGLWIVDNIMVSHEGVLDIIPINTHGYTEVSLVFN